MEPRSDSTEPGDSATGAATEEPGASDTAAPDTAAPAPVIVIVARSGGFAGLRREWRAEPPAAQVPRWESLIDACPWDAASVSADTAPAGADRFLWDVRAQCGDDARGAHLRDDDVDGPWERLIAAVRDFASPDRQGPSTAPDHTAPDHTVPDHTAPDHTPPRPH